MLNNTLVLHKGDTVYMDGKLELKNRYSLIRVIYHSMGDNYIPYIVGCIIEGPKGGSYMLDNFGLGHLFRYFDLTTKQGTQCLV